MTMRFFSAQPAAKWLQGIRMVRNDKMGFERLKSGIWGVKCFRKNCLRGGMVTE